MTATNIFYNFVGFRYSPPEYEEVSNTVVRIMRNKILKNKM